MLGSTHGTFTTDPRALVVACGETPRDAVHGVTAVAGDLDLSGRPLHLPVPDLDRFFRPESVSRVRGTADSSSGVIRHGVARRRRRGVLVHAARLRRHRPRRPGERSTGALLPRWSGTPGVGSAARHSCGA